MGQYHKKLGLSVSRTSTLTFLRVLLVLLVLWCEIGVFSWSVSSCRWPDLALNGGFNHDWTHVLLVADPQILDLRSYPGRSAWLARLTQFFVDFNLRKSWRVATKLKPAVIVFLGDMTDGGRFQMDEDEYKNYYTRFKSIFRSDSSTSVYYIPGNHDVGLGNARVFSPHAKQRFQKYFGPDNQALEISGYQFILINAPDLVDEDYRRYTASRNFEQWQEARGGTIEFVKQVNQSLGSQPRILLSHIPLARPESANCGPLREKGSIHRGVGAGYQNLLGKETTDFLLSYLHPNIIFSGDDHDYCDYEHPPQATQDGHTIREVTVKSFSMAMGVKNPGFHLLSLPAPSLSRHMLDAPCFLPNQVRLYTHTYGTAIALCIAYLAMLRLRLRRRLRPITLKDLSLSSRREIRVPSPLWSAVSESELRSPDEYGPLGTFSMPLLSSRSMMTASLMPHSSHDVPAGSPYTRSIDLMANERYNTPYSTIDGSEWDRASYLPKPVSQKMVKGIQVQSISCFSWRKGQKGWRPLQRGNSICLPTKLLRDVLCCCRCGANAGWAGQLWNDILYLAWPPLVIYVLITVLLIW